MNKLLLSLVLLLFTIAVSYFHAARAQANVDSSFIVGKKFSQRELLAFNNTTDSLSAEIGRHEILRPKRVKLTSDSQIK